MCDVFTIFFVKIINIFYKKVMTMPKLNNDIIYQISKYLIEPELNFLKKIIYWCQPTSQYMNILWVKLRN